MIDARRMVREAHHRSAHYGIASTQRVTEVIQATKVSEIVRSGKWADADASRFLLRSPRLTVLRRYKHGEVKVKVY